MNAKKCDRCGKFFDLYAVTDNNKKYFEPKEENTNESD